MAVVNRVDLAAAGETLREFMSTQIEDAKQLRIENLSCPSDGFSYETVVFDVVWQAGREYRRELVARVQPSPPTVHPSYDIEREYRVLDAVSKHTPVPVPTIFAFETDPAVLGAPFILMERVAGRVPADNPPFTVDGWVLALSPEDQRELVENSLRTMAQVHAADWHSLGLTDLPRGLDHQIDHFERFYSWAMDGRLNPVIEAGLDWVRANKPTEQTPHVLNWGDARLGNQLFAPNSTQVLAVLDWEWAALAAPELDLSWWLFFLRHHTEGIGVPPPPGFPSIPEIVQRYEELSGRTVVDLEFYETFAALRFAIMMQRAASLLIMAGQLPADDPMPLQNPGTAILARMLDLPDPGITASTFVHAS